jgi:hypothetical protein
MSSSWRRTSSRISSDRLLQRQHRLDLNQVQQRCAFGRIHPAISRSQHRRHALIRRQLTKLTEALRNRPSLLRWKRAQPFHRSTHLPALIRSQPLHRLIPLQNPLPLIGSHRIELRQTLPHPLLGHRRKLLEPRFASQRLLLLLERQVAVLVHPLGQMLALRSVQPRTAWPDQPSPLVRARRTCMIRNCRSRWRTTFDGSRRLLSASDLIGGTLHPRKRSRMRPMLSRHNPAATGKHASH